MYYLLILKPVLSLFRIIRDKRFVKGTPQDSHEALRLILGALKEEEINVSLQFSDRHNYH